VPSRPTGVVPLLGFACALDRAGGASPPIPREVVMLSYEDRRRLAAIEQQL